MQFQIRRITVNYSTNMSKEYHLQGGWYINNFFKCDYQKLLSPLISNAVKGKTIHLGTGQSGVVREVILVRFEEFYTESAGGRKERVVKIVKIT